LGLCAAFRGRVYYNFWSDAEWFKWDVACIDCNVVEKPIFEAHGRRTNMIEELQSLKPVTRPWADLVQEAEEADMARKEARKAQEACAARLARVIAVRSMDAPQQAYMETNQAKWRTKQMLEKVERVSANVARWLAERAKESMWSPLEEELARDLVRLREATALFTTQSVKVHW